MADINNFTEIAENFDTIKTLLNSIRAQGILNTSDVDKLLIGINSKLEKIHTDEDVELIKMFLSELKQNLDERHSTLLSKFGAIEALFSNLLKNSSETLKSSEVKELFDIVATNLSVFSREVVSQKETLSEIALRLDAMRSDDTQKKEIIKNISFLKNDVERLTNGFDSIVLSLNENFKTVIQTISNIDPTESVNKFAKEIEDIANSSNTILSALQMIDKKTLQLEDTLRGVATQDDLESAKKSINNLVLQECNLVQSIDNLAEKYYKIDNLSDKIDASVDILAGLKTLLSERDEQGVASVLNKITGLEQILASVSTTQAFDEFKHSLEDVLNTFDTNFIKLEDALNVSADKLQKIQGLIQALGLDVSFKALNSDITKSEENVKEHVTTETGKLVELVDVNTTRTMNEISTSVDTLSGKLAQAQGMISTLCTKNFEDIEESISGLKTVVSQIDENNVSANNAIFSNITDRLALFENSLRTSLSTQENCVLNSSKELIEQISAIKELSGVLDYKMDASAIEIGNAKVEFSALKSSVDDVLALDFVNKVKDLKVDLYAAKQELVDAVDSYTSDLSDKFSNELFGKYELLISKLDSFENELKLAQSNALSGIKSALDSVSASLVDILSYVSTKQELNTDELESKIENISKIVSDNHLSFLDSIRDIVDIVKAQVEENIKNIQADTVNQLGAVNSCLEANCEQIRSDVQKSYNKLLEVQENFGEIKDSLVSNSASISENITGAIASAESIKTDFDTKLSGLKVSILDKISEFEKNFTCQSADRISEIKFTAETLHNKSVKNAIDVKDEMKGEIVQLAGSLKLSLEELSENIANVTLKTEGARTEIIDFVRNDFTSQVNNSLDELENHVTDVSDNLTNKVDDVVSKFENLEGSVNNLTATTTSSLTSTLAKILENFVSLKAILNNYNDKATDDLAQKVEIITSDFAKLREKFNATDASIDEDLTRQLSIIENNFEMLNQNLVNMFAHNDDLLTEKLNAGLTEISTNLHDTVSQNLSNYKERIEALFDDFSAKNEEQAKLISGRAIELSNILHKTLEEQSETAESSLKLIAEELKSILDDNIKLTSCDYEALKVKLEEFLDSMTEQNKIFAEDFKAQFDDIAKFVDAGLDIQAREVNSKFDEITESVKNISSAALKLNEDVVISVNSISQGVKELKEEILLSAENNTKAINADINSVSDSVIESKGAILAAVKSNAETIETTVSGVSDSVKELKEEILLSAENNANTIGNNIRGVSDSIKELKEEILLSAENNTKNLNCNIDTISNNIDELKSELTSSVENNALTVVSKLEEMLTDVSHNNENTVSSVVQLTNNIKTVVSENLENGSNDVKSKFNILIEHLEQISTEASNRASEIKNMLKADVVEQVEELYKKVNDLFEEHSLNLVSQFSNNNSVMMEELNTKAIEFKASFEILNSRLDKDELSRMNVFQSQLQELSASFNVLMDEAKAVTKSEISAIADTLIRNGKETMEEIEQSIESKVNSILASNADTAADELQSMEMFANKILEQVESNKQVILSGRDFINNFIKSEIDIITENIEKETDVIVGDLLEQMSSLKDFQKDEFSKLTIHIENSIEDYLFSHINDLKSYIDLRTDNTVISAKIDDLNEGVNNINVDLNASKNDILSAINLFDKKFTDKVLDKYEEIKLISSQYSNEFGKIDSSVSNLISEFAFSKKGIDVLEASFADLKAQILNKSFDEAFQASVTNQVTGIENLVKEQLGYLEDISELCCANLPELTEMNAIVKHGLISSVESISSKLDEQNSSVQEELSTLKTDVITQFLNIFNQISFVAEQEEILDFIQEKHSELITILSHIVTTVDNVENVKDNLAVVDNKVDTIKEDIDLINEKITSIISSSGDIDYVYSLQDLESDIANLRISLKEVKESNHSQELEELIKSTNDIYALVDSLRNEFPRFDSDEFKKDFDALNEDIVSISTRTNKLILASDESYKALQENLQDFKLVINDLDERTRNFAQEAGLDRIDNKLGAINTMISNGAKTNQVFNQVFEYLAEWVDNAGAQIASISDKVETLDDIGQIKVMLEDLKAEAEDDSGSNELIEALGAVFDKQAKKIASLEAKLDRAIVEMTIGNKNNKVDMTPLEETLNRFLVAIDDRMSAQQAKINSLESKLEDVMSMINPKDTAQLTKKVGGMDRQIAKLNKSIEKIASHVVEK